MTLYNQKTTCCSWVRTLLHREEFDVGNTSYWYERAQQVIPNKTIEGEWGLFFQSYWKNQHPVE
ncbi:hypothetical protein OAU04_02185 [Alphaproteobacteria bacterium]|nr:hypothetical protein [Alphaproteobacteria bacterium]